MKKTFSPTLVLVLVLLSVVVGLVGGNGIFRYVEEQNRLQEQKREEQERQERQERERSTQALFDTKLSPKNLEELLNKHADIASKDPAGRTPLMYAALNDHVEVLEALLNSGIKVGVDVNASSGEEGWTPLMFAAANAKDPRALELLLNASADVHAKSKRGRTPLTYAARYNPNPEVLRALLEAEADINAKDMFEWTPLMSAARYNSNPEVLTALIKAGADAKVKNEAGKTALYYARKNKELQSTPALRLLEGETALPPSERRKQATEELLKTVGKADPEKVRQLIQDGADVNAKEENGWTPLMLAAIENTTEALTVLLDAGADAKAKNDKGRTALNYARKNKKLKGTRALKLLEEKTGR